ncbi:DUF333 domain-containing protein [Shewanella psychropiezotolerans]|uniref:DUF333 domain-containing protein n=1 Tax=Shewanella psychropiezotolerans TaxID=2593655 RepID=A0ABX5X4J6_9GAMM|nr:MULTISPECIES: DUF333 domain-containing protein [Shewanella]MPY25766.1 DUF333 domain-containing protein [Shewanella sp. YLB-07]QDO86274.1 DUF333 domain-containing protein [Shewanella psychropiezotolerans]
MIKPASITLLIASALMLSACNQDKPATAEETQAFTDKVVVTAVDTVVALANPASENPAAAYCEFLQGKLDLPTGVCTLPSGEAIEHWELFKRDHQQTKPQIGIANPASVYCESVDGKLDLPTGVCTLPNGEALDQWELLKRDHKQTKPQIGIANPASVYCESLDGKLELSTSICTLPSGEALDEWKLFRRDHKQTKPTS